MAIVVKLVLGLYVKKQGKKVSSGALEASGSDALFDAILSGSVLASAIVCLIWGVSLEAYVGVVIAAFIIKAGVEMMIETLNDIIGKREDPETVMELKRIICEEEAVDSGWKARSDTRSGYCAAVSAFCTFFGTSMTTGPGLPCVAM